MLHRLGMVVLVILLASCARLPEASTSTANAVPKEALPRPAEVPAQWGALVAVTPGPGVGQVYMWFEDAAGVVRGVPYWHKTNMLQPASVIRRN